MLIATLYIAIWPLRSPPANSACSRFQMLMLQKLMLFPCSDMYGDDGSVPRRGALYDDVSDEDGEGFDDGYSS